VSASASFVALASEAAGHLEGAGIAADEARRDAVVIARAVLGWDPPQWLADGRRPASPEFEAAFARAISRRRAREPVAYILGEREFYGRGFLVSEAVLIPRPETEIVIERALAILDTSSDPNPTILDVGTGSGCLAVTLALERPAARIVATDISRAALEIATANAARHGVSSGIAFRHGSLAAGLRDTVDLIVANPPYVAEDDRASLEPEVRDYEPEAALFGGPDGLAVIRALAPAASEALRPGGWLVMEIGAGQRDAAYQIVSDAGFMPVAVHDDLAGIPRVVIAQLRPQR
jgi:release factor glutamine methyltransferase